MSSSPPSSVEFETRPGGSGSSSPTANLAFLVHSQDTLLNNLPPDVDNKPLARQRRRRTSPDDQKILEEEYRRNPKPDKAARIEIVSKVALGEKEVQIWFQNRRQNSRRKSRPLHTAEVMAHLSAKTEVQSSVVDTLGRENTPEEDPENRERRHEEPRNVEAAENTELRLEEFTQKKDQLNKDETRAQDETKTEDVELESQATTIGTSSTFSEETQATLETEQSSCQLMPSSQETMKPTSLRPGYFANRRSASFVRSSQEEISTVAPTVPASSNPTRTLSRSGSYLRLSMTENGLARVVDRAAQSPSPPRLQHSSAAIEDGRKPANLRRSYSAAGLNDLFKQGDIDQNSRAKFPRVSQTGRSRDSRAWEFWCDSEARNSLAATAEQESSGSAADAIGLIRQNSRTALRPNARKGNTPVLLHSAFVQDKSSAKTPLKRASTMYGRIQQQPSKESVQTKIDTEAEEWERPNTDSDKENLEPDAGHAQAQVPRRRAHASAPNPRPNRPVLQENTQILSQNGSLGAMMEREKRQRASQTEVDGEVAAFMGSGSRTSTSIGEDLDCVQSLLSLSQGNWR